jgi:cytochrome b pre-mRNA-processing protein 3
MPIWPFKRSRADEDAERMLAAVTMASREPGLFGEGKVPDTLEGRFELITLHAALALARLRADPHNAPLAQAFADRLFSQFDAGLREAGVGDTAVPKRMHRMAGAFYGRVEAYVAALGDAAALESALARNVWRVESHPFAAALAARAGKLVRRQTEAPLEALFEAAVWRED